MRNRERYKELCKKESTIPLFSQGWWLDAVCGENNWDVYIVGSNMDIKLTQNNGIWIKYPDGQGIISRQSYEEKIVNEICNFIESLGLIRYEQQYHYNFKNYLPFFWRQYKEIIKYTVLKKHLCCKKIHAAVYLML